jgi:hypothetical protein
MLPVPPPNRREGGGKPVWHAGQGPCRHAGHHQQAQQSDPDIVLKSGEQRTVGNVVVKLAACCEKTAPGRERVGAFVQVFVRERSAFGPLVWHKVFSGWLFKQPLAQCGRTSGL